MTNIEKVKRILDAGHWVRVTYPENGYIQTVTSYHNNEFSFTENQEHIYTVMNPSFGGTIEVIQRIPTPYVAGDKVLVLSNPSTSCIDSQYIDMMVGKICEIKNQDGLSYAVFNEDKSDYWIFPPSCLAPAFDDEEISDLDRIISGKEAKIVIDGKEYTCVIK